MAQGTWRVLRLRFGAILIFSWMAAVGPWPALAGGVHFKSTPPHDCSSLQLVSVCGLPDGGEHKYRLEGTCTYFADGHKKSAPVKIGASFDVGSKVAVEEVVVGGLGSMGAKYHCNNDPWLLPFQISCNLLNFSSTSSDLMTAFHDPYYNGPGPLSADLVQMSAAIQMSQSCSQAPPPPPPPPPAKKPKLVIDPSKLPPVTSETPAIGVLKPGGGGGGTRGGPEVPQISQPTNNFATCGAVPVAMQAGGATTGLEFVFEYHTPNCGTSPSCWNAKTIAGVSSPVASASWSTSIPRSAFPSKGEWRLRARGLGQQSSTSSWSNWRGFRVKRNSECP